MKIMVKTIEVLAKIVASGHGDSYLEITALSEAVRARLGITELLVQPCVSSYARVGQTCRGLELRGIPSFAPCHLS